MKHAKMELIGKQKNLDRNKNGKIDSEDLQMIRENRNMADGGMMADGGITSVYQAKKIIGDVEKSNKEEFSWYVPNIDYDEEDYKQEYGTHLTDKQLIDLANELKGQMADGGEIELYYVKDSNGNVKNI